MARQSIISAIDLGTDKCVTLIAGIDAQTHHLNVMGVAAVPSRGVRKSQIVDLEQVISTMTESLDAAERMAGLEISSSYFSISGAHIACQNSRGVVAVAAPNQEIVLEDVDRVIEAARAVSLPADREILHVVPHDFTVDSQEGIKDPVGMTGIRLETEAHIITGMGTAIRNLTKCAQDLGLEVDGFVFSGFASADVVLSETEKELGVLLIDIGAGTTSVCAFIDGALSYSGVFPVGARHITQDIALGCRLSLDDAEKIKLFLTEDDFMTIKPRAGESKDEFKKRKAKEDHLDLSKLNITDKTQSLSKSTLFEGIMVPRMKEIFTLIGKELKQKNILSDIPAGLVITGGGAETIGIVEVAKRTLNLPARVGVPLQLQGLIEDIQKPSFSTSVGLLLYGQKHSGVKVVSTSFNIKSVFQNFKFGHMFNGIKSIFKSILP